MELLVVRYHKKPSYTIGKLYINNKYFCDTLEDTDRHLTQDMPPEEIQQKKVAAKTAIPTGRYPVELSKSAKFKRWLPLITNVPAFTGVRIHRGNTDADTEGCILVGYNKAKGKVLQSRDTENRLMDILFQLPKAEPIYITIR